MRPMMLTGLAITVAGAAKAFLHARPASELDVFLAQRCLGGTTNESLSLLAEAHCWGCPAMVVGVTLIALAWVVSRHRVANPG